MPLQVTNEKRKYTRLAHTLDETNLLRDRGFKSVVSSNVSAVAIRGDALVIRFHGGATYEYPGMRDRYTDIMSAPSKGKWVWREIRRKNVPYNRVGDIVIEDDVDDRDLMREDAVEPDDTLMLVSTMMSTQTLYELGIIASLALAETINSKEENDSRQT